MAPSLPQPDSGLQELLLAIHINRENLQETMVLLKINGKLLASVIDLKRWRIPLPPQPPFSYQGRDYYALHSLPGISYTIDESTQSLWIDAKPGIFPDTKISGSSLEYAAPTPSSPGGFVNYDLHGQSTAFDSIRLDSLMEMGLFNGWGVGVSNFLARDVGNDARLIRLDTTWTMDQPEQLASFRIGDAISTSGAWGRPVRFAGVQWATNFQTQPGFITFPMPSIEGEAGLPSMVDVYVDNIKLLNREVQPGPFTINNIPAITGLREMRLVVRDLLGREQTVSQPYYASPELLRKNLHEFSYEIGPLRQNYGLNSNDYGDWFAAGTHRLGFSDDFTGEGHAELLEDQQNIGLGGVFLAPLMGVFDVAAAGSHSRKGLGSLLSLGWQRQTSRLSFGGRAQFASKEFTQLGLNQDRPAPRLLSTLHLGLATAHYGNININHIHQDYRDQDDVSLINVNYNLSFGKGWFLSLSAFNSLGDDNKGVTLTLSHTLGERTNAGLTVGRQDDSSTALVQVQRNLPPGSGVGYRLLAGYDGGERIESGVTLQNEVGTYSLDASLFQDQYYVRANASGGLAIMGEDAFLSRRINSSFAVVQVPDYPNVRVYAENQLVAKTNAWGNALVPALRPYQDNHIRIEQADLPFDTQIDTLSLHAAPYFRSGSLLKFPVRRSRGATLKIRLDNGEMLPSGALVQIIGRKKEFPVALQGTVYMTELAPSNRLRVLWHEQSCEIEVSYPETEDPLPDLGTFTCHGVSP
ncbi:MAG: fimbria/pilus outer membrane usher protein [Methylosarcina sp.]